MQRTSDRKSYTGPMIPGMALYFAPPIIGRLTRDWSPSNLAPSRSVAGVPRWPRGTHCRNTRPSDRGGLFHANVSIPRKPPSSPSRTERTRMFALSQGVLSPQDGHCRLFPCSDALSNVSISPNLTGEGIQPAQCLHRTRVSMACLPVLVGTLSCDTYCTLFRPHRCEGRPVDSGRRLRHFRALPFSPP